MIASDNYKDGASKSNNDGDVCELNDMLQNMNTAEDNKDIISVCANCGKEDANNMCNKCKQVKYCNAVCKKIHKKKHKKDCEEYVRLADERTAELHDVELFQQPPPYHEDCPICFILLPTLETGYKYKSCCGKVICSGCSYAPVYDHQGNKVDNQKCAFCRTPHPPSNDEAVKRLNKLVEKNDPRAIYNLGCYYYHGANGFPQDYKKALKLYHRAAELGHAGAHCNIGSIFYNGEGFEIDKNKANHYYEVAAMRGDIVARYCLGNNEWREGNFDRALKHYMIAVTGGYNDSLEAIKQLYSIGDATKEDYTKALQLYQEYLGEIKSSQRDKAAAACEDHRYY